MRQHYFVVSLMDAWLGVMGVTPLSAQSSGTEVLTGTVTDPSGAVVRNVSVTLTNNDTGQVRAVVTGTGGTYRFPLIPSGAYRVRFAAAGFKVSEVPAVTVNVSETPVLNQTLEVGQQAESVVVQAEAAALQTADSTLGPVVSGSTIAELPLATRNFTQVLGLEAGATSVVNNGTALGQATLDLAVNGAASRGTTSKWMVLRSSMRLARGTPPIPLDYLISSKHTMQGRYLFTEDPPTTTFGIGTLPGAPSTTYYANTISNPKLTSLVTNSFINVARSLCNGISPTGSTQCHTCRSRSALHPSSQPRTGAPSSSPRTGPLSAARWARSTDPPTRFN